METTLTDFQRNFRAVREAADRGETITVKSNAGNYVFARMPEKPARPFADLERFFGVVHRHSIDRTRPHEIIRNRLKARGAG